jgi:hypothetical protein
MKYFTRVYTLYSENSLKRTDVKTAGAIEKTGRVFRMERVGSLFQQTAQGFEWRD